jgi:hypothetical protein
MTALSLPQFNQTQLIFIFVLFTILFLLYNFLLCGGVWCYGKMGAQPPQPPKRK